MGHSSTPLRLASVTWKPSGKPILRQLGDPSRELVSRFHRSSCIAASDFEEPVVIESNDRRFWEVSGQGSARINGMFGRHFPTDNSAMTVIRRDRIQ